MPGPEPQLDLFAARTGRRIWTVRELTAEVRRLLEGRWDRVWLTGELSNFKAHRNGHAYFSLKDEGAQLAAVMFRGQRRLLRFDPKDGQEVLVQGRLTVYEPRGQYQLIVDSMEPKGLGALQAAFEALKATLAAEGLFDPGRKRPLPHLPRRVGVVTSPSGAAIRDFLRVLHRRHPGVSVLVAPARVQGEGAAEEIATQLRRLDARGDCDVLVVTRGGGSIEDLWAFNEEVVARAIAACETPVVSAVGHEVDFTIADFVADHRSPTPSAAAEQVVPEQRQLRRDLRTASGRLGRALEVRLDAARARTERMWGRVEDPRRALARRRLHLEALRARQERVLVEGVRVRRRAVSRGADTLGRLHPRARLILRRGAVDAARRRLERVGRASLDEARRRERHAAESLAAHHPRARLQASLRHLAEVRHHLADASPRPALRAAEATLGRLEERLAARMAGALERRRLTLDGKLRAVDALSPLKVLDRGFSVVRDAKGEVVRAYDQVTPGDAVSVRLARGHLTARVVEAGEGPPAEPTSPDGEHGSHG